MTYFVPKLAVILLKFEDEKRSPLTPDEVIELRDKAACMMITRSEAARMDNERGGPDLDPENCWYDWQMFRRVLGRKPDLDPGARVQFVDSEDASYLATVEEAQRTLGQFQTLAEERDPRSVMIKARIDDSEGHAFVWLNQVRPNNNGFTAEFFEVPPPLRKYKVGDRLAVTLNEVLDWMINDNGTLYGGYSLRYQRTQIPEHEQASFDGHIGVSTYA